MENTLHAILTAYSAQDLLDKNLPLFKAVHAYHSPPESPISLDGNLSVRDACCILANNHISSAPITMNGEFLGQLDMSDFVNHILEVLNNTPMDISSSPWSISDLLSQKSQSDYSLSSLPRHKPLVVVGHNTPLIDVIEEYVRSGAHRIAVVNLSTNSFLGVISQSTIAALVVSQYGLRKPKTARWEGGQRSVKEANVIKTNVVTIEPQASVTEALYLMETEKISSVAITTGKHLLGSISLSDVKHILSERIGWKKLFEHCDVFFKQVRLSQSNERMGQAIIPNYTIDEQTTVITALEKMVATRAHRIWVVDDDNNLVGLVSLSAIIPLLLK
ncbi:cell separation during budding [Kappamyces sp. JEL0680]|nr:cell separation during budding [Kappamyces sp. JEL0680]